MKRFFCLTLILVVIFSFFSACSKSFTLDGNVSELRSCLYEGKSDTLHLKAGYGFKETPFVNDGKVGDTAYILTFKLIEKETEKINYNLSFSFNETVYNGTFKLNPVTNTMTCAIEIDGFNLKEFTVQISFAGNSESITLKSIVPENTISYSNALKLLQKNQGALISHYTTEDGVFNAEIYARILIKDRAPYWYIGIASGNDNLKALLIDGVSGEVLAIREIF